jgi:small subunit ribosomal protein S1
MKVQSQQDGQEMAAQDDGWWAAVLEEEESRAAPPAARSQKAEAASKALPDWERAVSIYRKDEIVSMAVTGHNRGGLLVEGDRLNGFVPCSHLLDLPIQPEEEYREDCLSAYVGRTLRLKIIECVPEEGRMIFSERAARAEAGKRPVLFNTIQTGQRVNGEVTNVTEFGVFVDLGGVEGLIHISELSWGRVSHPSQICKLGQHVEVLVMEVAPERCRIALSLKRLMPNPWITAEEHFPIDAVVPAVVTALVPYGVFARLEEGLEGLIHASEIPLPPNATIKGSLTPGQNVQVRIIQVDASRQRLGLSMKLD